METTINMYTKHTLSIQLREIFKIGSTELTGTACFEKCKQLLEYQNLLLLSEICGQCYNTFYGCKL